ncbi:MAG: patatin-like phospholipase family protein [Acidimicrobiales bacterium]
MSVHVLRPDGPVVPAGRVAFVLGGGGNLGAIQVGMLRALAQRGVVPDALFGCSVGAINAAALAGDPSPAGVERLTGIWSRLDSEVICPPGRLSGLLLLTRKYRSLQSNEALTGLLESSLPYRRIEQTAVPLEVVATSLRTGREHWFTEGPIVPAVLASSALPAVFPPVVIEGEPFIDGAVVDNVPIGRAVERGATLVYVLHVGNFERPRPEPRRPIDALLQSFSIARNYRFQAEIRRPPPDVELVVLPSIDPGPIKPNDFGRSRVLIERAAATAGAFLDRRNQAAVVV